MKDFLKYRNEKIFWIMNKGHLDGHIEMLSNRLHFALQKRDWSDIRSCKPIIVI